MAFDYKKEYKEFYLPAKKPEIIEIPAMPFVAVRGSGNPNEEDGAYSHAVSILYAISYTIKMSKMGDHRIDGYFDYVVPPLEGLWWMDDGRPGVDYSNKSGFCWISMIRLPEFVTQDEFNWAQEEAARKKKLDTASAEYFSYHEGLCVQCLHIGPYDDEPATISAMQAYAAEHGYTEDFTNGRMHHEIYLGDPRKISKDKQRTVIRHPVIPQ